MAMGSSTRSTCSSAPRSSCENKAAYVSNYRQLSYPGGDDVPRTEGVCTDTLVRALRNAGWDLQSGIHEDAARKPSCIRWKNRPTPTSTIGGFA